jgi:hypothetical protein
MTTSTLVRLTACLSSILSLVSCSGTNASTQPCNPGDPGCGTGSGGGAGGSTQGTPTGGASAGGASGVGGVPSTGGWTTNGTTSGNGGASSATGGTRAATTASNTGGITSATGGRTSTGGTTTTGGSSSAAGGKTSAGGTTATGGSSSAVGGKTSSGTTATGGLLSTGGTTNATGGVNATGGSAGCAATDQGGKALAKAGDSTSASNAYLNLCTMRLINNNWGSLAVQQAGTACNAPMTVKVNSDRSLGWTFNRPNCGDGATHPDFPELEFGVAPFGTGSSLLTSPAFSSTTLLPIQVKNITSASVTLTNFNVSLQNQTNWNANVEFWLSRNNPATSADGGVYAELMAVLGWDANFWACTAGVSGNVNSGGKSYNLCHQSDSWGSSPKWRFFQFEISGKSTSFNGTVDVKAFLDWFFSSNYASGATKDLWLTRIEVGTEIGDVTSGSCTIGSVSFNINGTSQSPVLAN